MSYTDAESRTAGALQSGHVSPPRRRHAARQLVCSAWPHLSIVALSPSASKQTQQSSEAPPRRRGGVASPWTRRRSRRVATSTADAVALAHTENRAASRTARNAATRATAADWSGHAARGAGLAAPTLKARRTLGERAASGARASRAFRNLSTERAAFSTAGLGRSLLKTPSAQLRRARAAAV